MAHPIAARTLALMPLVLATASMADGMVSPEQLPRFVWGAVLISTGMAVAALNRFGGRTDIHRPLHMILMGALALSMTTTTNAHALGVRPAMLGMTERGIPFTALLIASCCIACCASVLAAMRPRTAASNNRAARFGYRAEHLTWAALMGAMVVAMVA